MLSVSLISCIPLTDVVTAGMLGLVPSDALGVGSVVIRTSFGQKGLNAHYQNVVLNFVVLMLKLIT